MWRHRGTARPKPPPPPPRGWVRHVFVCDTLFPHAFWCQFDKPYDTIPSIKASHERCRLIWARGKVEDTFHCAPQNFPWWVFSSDLFESGCSRKMGWVLSKHRRKRLHAVAGGRMPFFGQKPPFAGSTQLYYSPPHDSRPTSKRRFKRPSPISDMSPTKTIRDPPGKVQSIRDPGT